MNDLQYYMSDFEDIIFDLGNHCKMQHHGEQLTQSASSSSIYEGEHENTSALHNLAQRSNSSARFYEDQIGVLRQEIQLQNEQISQKDGIIRQLQERCTNIVSYEAKISMLERKVTQLEKMLDNLEVSTRTDNTCAKKEQYISEQFCYILGEHAANNSESRTSQLQQRPTSKQNRRSSLKPKQTKKLHQKCEGFKQDQKIVENKESDAEKTEKALSIAATSSKLLQTGKLDNEKRQQIDNKFNRIKQNLPSFVKNNKNIEEIYSILNGHKFKREELAIKQINDKLETILNQSVRLKTSSVQNKSMSQHERIGTKTSSNASFVDHRSSHMKDLCFSTRLPYERNRPENEASRQKTRSCYESDIFFRPKFVKKSVFTEEVKIKDSKYQRIINATNVDEMLKARKCLAPQREVKNNKYLNKSSGAGVAQTIYSKMMIR